MQTDRRSEFSPKTKDQIEWLKQYLGLQRVEQVISAAVADFHRRKRTAMPARLVERDDGWYDLTIGGEIVASCTAQTVKNLPAKRRRELLEGEVLDHRGVFSELILAGVKTKETVVLYPEVIQVIFGAGR
jgi:hypothetical protein